MPRKSTLLPPEPAAAMPGGTLRHWAEEVALTFLESRGLRLLAANHTEKGGELDLVMKDGEETVFVEVRQRRARGYGSAAESLDARKIRRLRRTARLFLLRHYGREDVPCRFDAVLVSGDAGSHSVRHVRGFSDG